MSIWNRHKRKFRRKWVVVVLRGFILAPTYSPTYGLASLLTRRRGSTQQSGTNKDVNPFLQLSPSIHPSSSAQKSLPFPLSLSPTHHDPAPPSWRIQSVLSYGECGTPKIRHNFWPIFDTIMQPLPASVAKYRDHEKMRNSSQKCMQCGATGAKEACVCSIRQEEQVKEEEVAVLSPILWPIPSSHLANKRTFSHFLKNSPFLFPQKKFIKGPQIFIILMIFLNRKTRSWFNESR